MRRISLLLSLRCSSNHLDTSCMMLCQPGQSTGRSRNVRRCRPSRRTCPRHTGCRMQQQCHGISLLCSQRMQKRQQPQESHLPFLQHTICMSTLLWRPAPPSTCRCRTGHMLREKMRQPRDHIAPQNIFCKLSMQSGMFLCCSTPLRKPCKMRSSSCCISPQHKPRMP